MGVGWNIISLQFTFCDNYLLIDFDHIHTITREPNYLVINFLYWTSIKIKLFFGDNFFNCGYKIKPGYYIIMHCESKVCSFFAWHLSFCFIL